MRASITGATLLCLFYFVSAQGGINQWTASGPPGGTYRDIEISPTNPDVYYAAYTRTFFRSTDGADTWQGSRDFAAELVSIAVDPTDGTRVYAAALTDGLYRSDDAGQTFTKIAPGTGMIWAVGVGGADGKTVYYSNNNGTFWQSTDRGQTWTQRSTNPQGITAIYVDPANGNSLSALHGPEIWQSSDGGQTWTQSSPGGPNIWVYGFARIGAGKLAAATANGIYLSPDNGATWSLDQAGPFTSISTDPAVPGALVASFSGTPVVWRKATESANWVALNGNAALGPAQRVLVGGGTPSRLVIANPQGVMRSTNNGTSWVESTMGPNASGASIKMATTNVANAQVFAYTGTWDGVFATSQDNGWQRVDLSGAHSLTGQLQFGVSALAVVPGSPQTLYMGTFGSGMFRSTDGGHTWSGPGTGLQAIGARAIAFDPVNPSVMYTNVVTTNATPVAAGLYWSTDAGATWTPRSVNLPGVAGERLVVDPANGSRLFLAAYQGFGPAGSGGLYRSVDGGVNWTQSFNGIDVNDVAIDPSDSKRVYAATATGLMISTDGGDSFAPNTPFSIITSLEAVSVIIDPAIPTTIYAADWDNSAGLGPPHQDVSSHILRSVDRGQTWEVLRSDTDSPKWFVGDLVLDPTVPSLLYASTGVRGIGAFEIQNDLALTLTGHSGTRPVGSASSFDLSAENNGTFSATGVKLNVQLPAGLTNVAATSSSGTCNVAGTTLTCSVPVLAPAATVTAHVTYTPPAAMAIPLTATVSAHERDNKGDNNSASATATAGEVVDLHVTVTPSATTVTTGGNLTYTVQVTNAGPSDSSAETVTFALPSGVSLGSTLPNGCSGSGGQVSCTLGALASGATQSLSFTATANSNGSAVANASVSAASTASDPDTSNNSGQATVTVNSPASSSGGGGGGSIDFAVLLGLILALARVQWVRLRRVSLV